MESEIIDFAMWYSGMGRSKVQAAYQRYLREQREALSQAAVTTSAAAFCPDCMSGRDAFEPYWKCPECREKEGQNEW